ncbi:MAG: type II toxin-antitoxin system VapC family toxin [Micropepsaceae bacterium]
MRVLLDTHILLAVIREETDKLSPSIKRLLDREDTEAFVSVASLWEAAIKWRLGKLPLPSPPARLPELVEDIGLVQVPILASHAVADVVPEPATRDPFDRLLLAQCKVEGLLLLTTDRALVEHPLVVRLV